MFYLHLKVYFPLLLHVRFKKLEMKKKILLISSYFRNWFFTEKKNLNYIKAAICSNKMIRSDKMRFFPWEKYFVKLIASQWFKHNYHLPFCTILMNEVCHPLYPAWFPEDVKFLVERMFFFFLYFLTYQFNKEWLTIYFTSTIFIKTNCFFKIHTFSFYLLGFCCLINKHTSKAMIYIRVCVCMCLYLSVNSFYLLFTTFNRLRTSINNYYNM